MDSLIGDRARSVLALIFELYNVKTTIQFSDVELKLRMFCFQHSMLNKYTQEELEAFLNYCLEFKEESVLKDTLKHEFTVTANAVWNDINLKQGKYTKYSDDAKQILANRLFLNEEISNQFMRHLLFALSDSSVKEEATVEIYAILHAIATKPNSDTLNKLTDNLLQKIKPLKDKLPLLYDDQEIDYAIAWWTKTVPAAQFACWLAADNYILGKVQYESNELLGVSDPNPVVKSLQVVRYNMNLDGIRKIDKNTTSLSRLDEWVQFKQPKAMKRFIEYISWINIIGINTGIYINDNYVTLNEVMLSVILGLCRLSPEMLTQLRKFNPQRLDDMVLSLNNHDADYDELYRFSKMYGVLPTALRKAVYIMYILHAPSNAKHQYYPMLSFKEWVNRSFSRINSMLGISLDVATLHDELVKLEVLKYISSSKDLLAIKCQVRADQYTISVKFKGSTYHLGSNMLRNLDLNKNNPFEKDFNRLTKHKFGKHPQATISQSDYSIQYLSGEDQLTNYNCILFDENNDNIVCIELAYHSIVDSKIFKNKSYDELSAIETLKSSLYVKQRIWLCADAYYQGIDGNIGVILHSICCNMRVGDIISMVVHNEVHATSLQVAFTYKDNMVYIELQHFEPNRTIIIQKLKLANLELLEKLTMNDLYAHFQFKKINWKVFVVAVYRNPTYDEKTNLDKAKQVNRFTQAEKFDKSSSIFFKMHFNICEGLAEDIRSLLNSTLSDNDKMSVLFGANIIGVRVFSYAVGFGMTQVVHIYMREIINAALTDENKTKLLIPLMHTFNITEIKYTYGMHALVVADKNGFNKMVDLYLNMVLNSNMDFEIIKKIFFVSDVDFYNISGLAEAIDKSKLNVQNKAKLQKLILANSYKKDDDFYSDKSYSDIPNITKDDSKLADQDKQHAFKLSDILKHSFK